MGGGRSAGRMQRPEKSGSRSSCSSRLPGGRKSAQLQLVVKSICQILMGKWAEQSFGPRGQRAEEGGCVLLAGGKSHNQQPAASQPISERDQLRLLEEPQGAAGCRLGPNSPVLPHAHQAYSWRVGWPRSPAPSMAAWLSVSAKAAAEYSQSHFSQN